MATMTDIEKTLLDTILKANWGLADDLALAKITWTRAVFRAEGGGTFDEPRIEVSHKGVPSATREQEFAEIFDYYVRIRVYKWSSGSGDDDIETAKDDKWEMMEEIKRIVKLYKKGGSETLPTNWKGILIMSFRSIDSEELKKPLLGEEFVVRVKFHWSP